MAKRFAASIAKSLKRWRNGVAIQVLSFLRRLD
jgi:hypothetical protein